MAKRISLKKRVDAYAVMARAVEEGAAYGWRRAFKYHDKPTDEQATEAITQAVLNEICEWFQFGE